MLGINSDLYLHLIRPLHKMRRWGSLVRLSLALLGCTAIQAFLVPLGGRTAQIGIASSIRSTKVSTR